MNRIYKMLRKDKDASLILFPSVYSVRNFLCFALMVAVTCFAAPLHAQTLVEGKNGNGATATANPVLIGGVDPSGAAVYLKLNVDGSLSASAGTGLTDTQLRASPVPMSIAALPLPSGAATSANQGTLNATATSIDTKTPALGQATMANSRPVVIASNQSSVPVTPASIANYSADVTLQNAATAVGNGTAMDVSGVAGLGIQVAGAGTYGIAWEGTIDGTNWIAVNAWRQGNAAITATTSNSPDLYFVRVNGLKQFRARITSYTSGTITISAHGTANNGSGFVTTINGAAGAVAVLSTADGLTSVQPALFSNSFPMLYNGATSDRQRTPATFKTFTISSALGAETAIWTPASGKKFRVMGWSIYSDTATAITLRDNTAGSVIYRTGASANAPIHSPPFGNGILSTSANNVLTIQATTAATFSGTVFGTEE